MELISVIRDRRSVRDYMDVAVDRATIEHLIDAAILAPSSLNTQPWAFAVLLGRKQLDGYAKRAKDWLLPRLGHSSGEPSLRHMLENPEYVLFCHAPALVIVLAKSSDTQDAEACCIAAGNLMLAARDEGLGTCWVGLTRRWFDLPEIKAELKIPKRYQVVAPVILGHPRAWPEPKTRNPAEVIWCP